MIYALGDVQGCLTALEKLLTEIRFDPAADILWFAGDLVNRGPDSLGVLRFVRALGEKHVAVLGNHDLHLLAMAHGVHQHHRADDTLAQVLAAPDCAELIDWLRYRPLLHHDPQSGCVLTHAGLGPRFDLMLAKQLAQEVEAVLRSEDAGRRKDFFASMYGNEPAGWDAALTGHDRLRCIVNHFTRMRFCHPDGSLELATKESMKVADSRGLVPWFRVPARKSQACKIIFGHWAALAGVTDTENVFALDTGCVWGYCLTAMRIADGQRFSVSCAQE